MWYTLNSDRTSLYFFGHKKAQNYMSEQTAASSAAISDRMLVCRLLMLISGAVSI